MAKPNEKEKREEEILDLREVMSNQRGRRVVRRLLASAGIWKSTFRPRKGVRPEDWVVFNAAQRELGQFLMDEACGAHPAGYELMNSEAAARAMIENAKRAQGNQDQKELEDE